MQKISRNKQSYNFQNKFAGLGVNNRAIKVYLQGVSVTLDGQV